MLPWMARLQYLQNWWTEKNGRLAFFVPTYTAFFNIIFWHEPLWHKLNNKISYSLVLRAANNGPNSILMILQMLQFCHARQYASTYFVLRVCNKNLFSYFSCSAYSKYIYILYGHIKPCSSYGIYHVVAHSQATWNAYTDRNMILDFNYLLIQWGEAIIWSVEKRQ